MGGNILEYTMFQVLCFHHKHRENSAQQNKDWIGLKANDQKSVSDSKANRVFCLWPIYAIFIKKNNAIVSQSEVEEYFQ